MVKNIFGYKVEIRNEVQWLNLDKPLSFYSDDVTKFDYRINILIRERRKNESYEYKSNNPKTILVTENGFASGTKIVISWNLSKLPANELNVELIIKNTKRNIFKELRQKALNIGYETITEKVDQILHELVLVPATFFFKDKVIIHGSCLYNKKYKKSFIFGGTGGVGKTSSLLELGKSEEWIFLSDDIVVVDRSGRIFPNYAYPKIYAYNTIGDKKLENKILKGGGFLNKLQWILVKKIDPARVRRRVAPDGLYNIEHVNPKLDNNLFLFRGKFEENIKIEKVNGNDSWKFEKDIIVSEYESVYRYIRWYEYNAIGLGFNPFITFDEIIANYDDMYKEIFSNSNNYLLKLDVSMAHNDFKMKMLQKISELAEE